MAQGKSLRIGILLNTKKLKAIEGTEKIVKLLKGKGVPFTLLKEEAEEIRHPDWGIEKERFIEGINFLLALGGDGTILRAARVLQGKSIPILGINVGGLGFLTETGLENLENTISSILKGNYTLDERIGLETRVKGEVLFSLNDTVVVRKDPARMIKIEVSTQDSYLTTFAADGLIISTPTGSTAHALSAGGPILHPQIEGILIVPICSHTLSQRPFLLPSHTILQIKTLGKNPAVVVCDGQITRDLPPGEKISLTATSYKVRLVRLKKFDFFSLLREKLYWKGHWESK